MGGVKARLPSPAEVATVRQWLHDSTGMHIDGCDFRRHSSGLALVAHYRNLKGHTVRKQIIAPDQDDFTELAVEMSNWIEMVEFGERKSVRPELVH